MKNFTKIPDPLIENKFKNIYNPSDDSYLIIDYFKDTIDNNSLDGLELKKIDNILDMGTGTGIISIFFLILKTFYPEFNPKIYASDILEDAIICSKGNEAKNNFQDAIKYIHSDLFNSFPESLKHKFNIIIFNPPYLPSISNLKTSNKTLEDISWNGGIKGIEIIERFLCQVAEFIDLNNKSYIYFISSSKTDVNELNTIVKSNGFINRILRRKHFFFEDIFLNRLEREILL